MSPVETGERVRASPERARSFCTVLAAISAARRSEAPLSRSLALMCSYWRARLVPFFTPLGGIAFTSTELAIRGTLTRGCENEPRARRSGGHRGAGEDPALAELGTVEAACEVEVLVEGLGRAGCVAVGHRVAQAPVDLAMPVLQLPGGREERRTEPLGAVPGGPDHVQQPRGPARLVERKVEVGVRPHGSAHVLRRPRLVQLDERRAGRFELL